MPVPSAPPPEPTGLRAAWLGLVGAPEDFVLRAGDVMLLVGRAEGIQRLAAL